MSALDRRDWLKQSSLALAGLSFSGALFGRRQQQMAEFWEKEVKSSSVRIGFNENPYGPGPMAKKAMMDAVAGSNRYPTNQIDVLIERIAKEHGLSKDHVLIGAGSSEILANTASLVGAGGAGNIIGANPTFSFWFGLMEIQGLTVKSIPLTKTKVHDLQAMQDAMDKHTKLVYVVNPNNPTGTVVADAELRQFTEKVTQTSVLLLDEAYTEYNNTPSFASLVTSNKNLIVAKTFSKIHGLAGARVGYALAHPETIKKLAAYQPWANSSPSHVSIAGAMAALDDKEFMNYTRTHNNQVRTTVTTELTNMGMTVIPSSASFLYFDASAFKGDLAATLGAANVNGLRLYEKGTGWRRISIGTMDEMQKFLEAIKRKM